VRLKAFNPGQLKPKKFTPDQLLVVLFLAALIAGGIIYRIIVL